MSKSGYRGVDTKFKISVTCYKKETERRKNKKGDKGSESVKKKKQKKEKERKNKNVMSGNILIWGYAS